MAKRTNRVALGLSIPALVAVLVVGSVVLVALYQSHLPEEQRSVYLLPREQWGFYQERFMSGVPPPPGFPPPPRDVCYYCGFFAVDVKYP